MPRPRTAAALGAAAALVAAAAPAVARADSLVYVKGGNVWIAQADGGRAHRVTGAANNWTWPSMADDGTVVVAGGRSRVNPGGTDSDGSTELYRLDQAGHQLGGTADTPGSNSSPACPAYPPTNVRVSPGGTRVVYDAFHCDSGRPFIEDLASAHFEAFATDYHAPAWLDDGHVLITHIGTTFGNAAFAVYDAVAKTGHGPLDDPYYDQYEAAASRDGRRVAVLENDGPNWIDGPHNADFVLYATAGDDPTQPVKKCTLGLAPAAIGNFTVASPTFSPDGSRLAWAAKDGIHFANTSNLDDCATVTDRLLVPGGAYPFLGKADARAVGGKLVLKARGARVRLSRAGTVAFTVTASQDGAGRASGTIAMPQGKAARLTPRMVKLRAGKLAKVTLELSRKDARRVRAAMRKGRRLAARVTLSATGANGARASMRLTMRIAR